MHDSKTTKKKCRLLYLVGELGAGGLERQLVYLIRTMDRDRHQPVVVIWNHNPEKAFFVEEIRSMGVPLHTFPPVLSKTEKLRAFRRLVKELSPEVVHSYCFYTNFAAWFAAIGSSSISIGSIRQNFLSERTRSGIILGRLSARLPRTQICNSLPAKTMAEKYGGYWKPKSIFLVRNGIDLTQFRPSPVPKGKIRLLAIGRLFPEKRWDRLLRTIAMVLDKGLKFEMLHAGDGPLRRELELQAKQLGLSDTIQFLGVRRDISSLFEQSNFLVHTADDEGCPNVVMEAMASGRAVVATDAGDIPYLVEDGKTGFVVPRESESTLVDSISKLIARNDLASSMGEAARSKAENELGLDRLLLETLNAYHAAGWMDA